MNKKIILFDIDYTLFNGKTFRETLLKEIGKEIQPESIDSFAIAAEEVYISLRDVMAHFDTALFAQALSKRFDVAVDEVMVKEETESLSRSGVFLYEETESVLKELSLLPNTEIGIFSTGFFDLQKAKIDPVIHFISEEHMHIFTDKQPLLLDIVEKYKNEKLYLVDDFFQLLQKAKEIDSHLTTVWMKRGRHAEKIQGSSEFVPDFAITSLDEVLSIVDKS